MWSPRADTCARPYVKGHVPVGQESLPPDLELLVAEKVEKSFCNLLLPHFWQLCFLELLALSRNSILCPHLLHLYSNIGIVLSPDKFVRDFTRNTVFLNTVSNPHLNFCTESSTEDLNLQKRLRIVLGAIQTHHPL